MTGRRSLLGEIYVLACLGFLVWTLLHIAGKA